MGYLLRASCFSLLRVVALTLALAATVLAGCTQAKAPHAQAQLAAARAVTLELDEARAVTGALGPAGGSLSVELASGGRVTLTVPRGALLATTRVRMIPLTRATGLPLGGGLGGGVQLEPEGLVLFRPASLAFERMRPLASGTPRVVAWSGRGAEVHRRTHRDESGTPTIRLAHFSGYAFGGETPEDARTESGRAPATAEARALGAMPEVVSVPPGTGRPTDPRDDESARRAAEALTAWFVDALRPKLLAARTDEAALAAAVGEYLSWWAEVESAGLGEWFRSRQQEAQGLLADGLRNALRRSFERCRQNHAIEEVATVVAWLGTAQMLGLSDRRGLGYAENRDKVEECLRMKLDTTLLIRYGGESDDVRIEAELGIDDLELRTNPNLAGDGVVLPPFVASGPLHYRRFEVDLGDEGCRAVDLQHSDGAVEISVELDVNLRVPALEAAAGGGGGRPAPPPIPYANIGMTPSAAASDGFVVACEGMPRVPMRTQLVSTATFAASRGDASGAGRIEIVGERLPAGATLFRAFAVMTPVFEGEAIHMELTHELTHGD